MRYIRFELVRQLTALKTIAIAVAFFVVLLGFFIFSVVMHRTAEEVRLEEMASIQRQLGSLVSLYRWQMTMLEQNGAVPGLRTTDLSQLDALYRMVGREMRGISNQRAQLTLEHPTLAPPPIREHAEIIRRYENLLVDFYEWREIRAAYLGVAVTEVGFDDATMEERFRGLTEAYVISRVQFYRYLQNMGLQPIMSPHEPSAFMLLHRILSTMGVFFLPIIAVLLTADVFSKESESGGYKILMLQPISRTAVYLSKLGASFVSCIAVLLVPLVAIFCIAAVVYGIGSGGYPVPFFPADALVSAAYETPEAVLRRLEPGNTFPTGFVPVSAYAFYVLPFAAVYLLLVLALSSFISMLARDSVAAMAAAIGIMLASFMLTQLGTGEALWNPLTYSDVNSLILGGHASAFWYPMLWAVLLTALGIVWFRKKDIIC
jgi:ABC-type transport system involved in multi-copper enzyme maturation permease subunit